MRNHIDLISYVESKETGNTSRLCKNKMREARDEYLEHVVVDVCFSFLNQRDFFSDREKSITEPV